MLPFNPHRSFASFPCGSIPCSYRAERGQEQIESEELRRRRTRYRDERAVGMELLYLHGGLSQMEIGRQMEDLDYTGVSRERKRLREKVGYDGKLRRSLRETEATLTSYVKDLTP